MHSNPPVLFKANLKSWWSGNSSCKVKVVCFFSPKNDLYLPGLASPLAPPHVLSRSSTNLPKLACHFACSVEV